MTFQAGVLIIGSLLWDENRGRPQWRAQRLNEKGVTPVPVPIRYGRFSDQRHAYTMVFSRLCCRRKQLGRGVVVPFAKPIKSFDDLLGEAKCLADAEGLGDRWKWGAVGLLKNPASKLPVSFSEKWAKYFKEKASLYQGFAGQTRGEEPVINREGFLCLSWPFTGEDRIQYDLLVATPTKPRMHNLSSLRRYPRATEIAAFVPADKTNYLINNILHGIRTSQDPSIWKSVTKLHSEFAAKWPQIASSLGEEMR